MGGGAIAPPHSTPLPSPQCLAEEFFQDGLRYEIKINFMFCLFPEICEFYNWSEGGACYISLQIGVCGRSSCSQSDVTCSCQPSKIAFKHVIVKDCQRNRTLKKLDGRRKVKRGRRCQWRNDVILSAVACECRCPNK